MVESPIRNLLVDKKDMAEEIALQFEGFLAIEKEGYKPVLPFPLSSINLKDRILLEIGTAFLTYAGGLREQPSIQRSVLLERCKGTSSGIRGTLSKMRSADLIKTSDEGDEITSEGLMEFKKLLTDLRKNHNEEVS